MQVFDYSDFSQNTTKIFEAALMDDVIVKNSNGYSYKILPLKNRAMEKSPIENIPCIEADITMQEIVELLRENRAGI
ncbi:hypothetical protein FACS1894102_5430 [Spirochaetia bacterium]|nr:hypothetical protein FACS1894102_5430 [Spirochaetia bacterium]